MLLDAAGSCGGAVRAIGWLRQRGESSRVGLCVSRVSLLVQLFPRRLRLSVRILPVYFDRLA